MMISLEMTTLTSTCFLLARKGGSFSYFQKQWATPEIPEICFFYLISLKTVAQQWMLFPRNRVFRNCLCYQSQLSWSKTWK